MKSKITVRVILAQAALAILIIGAAPLCSAFCLFTLPYNDNFGCTSPTISVYEYVNDNTRRRVLLSDKVELDFVDQGFAGPGWRRTSLVLTMLPADYNQSYAKQLVDICRFYAPSVNSHFFSANAFECSLLKEPATGWIFERVAFKSDPPVGGVCPAWSPAPIYRYYNNRVEFGDTAHRYSPDRSLKMRLEAEGWIDEGIGFCAVGWTEVPIAAYAIHADRVVDSAICEDESGPRGACVAVNQQAPMPRIIPAATQSLVFTYPNAPFTRRTGAYGADIHTAQTSLGYSEVDSHSFVQLSNAGFGIYVNSRDINSAAIQATSVNPIYQFSTRPPPDPAAADLRVMPWKDRFSLDVEISFLVRVQTLLRGADGHAIAHPVIELIDTKSRRNLYITIGTISGEPQADFTARDFGVGKPIVSTLFRKDPAFGVRIAGDTFLCNTDNLESGCPQGNNAFFRFRLRPVDIAAVVARARKLDPGLSASIADYAIDNFSFNNEVSGDAEIGLSLYSYTLQIYMRDSEN